MLMWMDPAMDQLIDQLVKIRAWPKRLQHKAQFSIVSVQKCSQLLVWQNPQTGLKELRSHLGPAAIVLRQTHSQVKLSYATNSLLT